MPEHTAAPPNTPPTAQARGGKSSFTGDEILTTALLDRELHQLAVVHIELPWLAIAPRRGRGPALKLTCIGRR